MVDGNGRELRKGLARYSSSACAQVSPDWPLAGGAYPLLSTRWDPHANSAALSGRALDPKPPAHVCDALAHRLQAEVSRERTRRIEAPTIVVNLQEDLVLLLLPELALRVLRELLRVAVHQLPPA